MGCLRNSKRAVCLEQSDEGEKAQRGQGRASCWNLQVMPMALEFILRVMALSREVTGPDSYFKRVTLATVWKIDYRRAWWK